MRVLLVANGYPPAAQGGVEVYTQTLAEGLAARGHVVEVFCRVSAPAEPEYTVRRELAGGVPVRRVVNDLSDAARFEDHYRNPRIEALFREHLCAFAPHVVHLQHGLALSGALPSVAVGLGFPVAVTLHDYWFICPRANLYTAEQTRCTGPGAAVDCVACLGGVRLGPLQFLRRWPLYKWTLHRLPARVNMGLRTRLDRPAAVLTPAPGRQAQAQVRTDFLLGQLRQAQRLFAPSAFVRSVYARYGLEPEHVEVLPLGIDLPRGERPTRAGPPRVAFIGSLLRHKGPDLLIEAFRQAPHLAAELWIYGGGDALDTYAEDLRCRAAPDPRIRWGGRFPRAALPEVLAGVDILVIPSRVHETYSLAAREALAAGVPVIASDLGALPEVIHPGVNGYLVPPDEPEHLARAIEVALDRLPALRAGTAARPPAPSVAKHIERLEAHYHALTAA